jgi:hypothetical protein
MKAILPALVIVLFASLVTGRAGSQRTGSPETPAASRPVTVQRPNWLIDSSCTVMPDPPVRDRSTERILGPAHYRCDRPGADIDVTVYLQKRAANGSWSTVDSRPVAAHGADTTRDRSEAQRTQSTAAPCADGVYRTFLRGTLTIQGRTQSVERDSGSTTNPCKSVRR